MTEAEQKNLEEYKENKERFERAMGKLEAFNKQLMEEEGFQVSSYTQQMISVAPVPAPPPEPVTPEPETKGLIATKKPKVAK